MWTNSHSPGQRILLSLLPGTPKWDWGDGWGNSLTFVKLSSWCYHWTTPSDAVQLFDKHIWACVIQHFFDLEWVRRLLELLFHFLWLYSFNYLRDRHNILDRNMCGICVLHRSDKVWAWHRTVFDQTRSNFDQSFLLAFCIGFNWEKVGSWSFYWLNNW